MKVDYRHCFYCVHEPTWTYTHQRKNHGLCEKRGMLFVDTGIVTTKFGTEIGSECGHYERRPPSFCSIKARAARNGKNIWGMPYG